MLEKLNLGLGEGFEGIVSEGIAEWNPLLFRGHHMLNTLNHHGGSHESGLKSGVTSCCCVVSRDLPDNEPISDMIPRIAGEYGMKQPSTEL